MQGMASSCSSTADSCGNALASQFGILSLSGRAVPREVWMACFQTLEKRLLLGWNKKSRAETEHLQTRHSKLHRAELSIVVPV